jgi:DNA polymerase III epsilon subunit-like protein
MYIVIDTETTGLPICPRFGVFPAPDELTAYEKARIVQIAWNIYNPEHELQKSVCYYILPTYDHDLNTEFHKITRETVLEKGIAMDTALDELHRDLLEGSPIVVGHNIDFDVNVILSEAHRTKHTLASCKIATFCTMKESRKVKVNGRYRYPKLGDLYKHYYGSYPEVSHDALADVETCAACYKKLIIF